MVKLADSTTGSISRRGVRKTLTAQDRERLNGAVETARESLCRFGARDRDMSLGTLCFGHPGGMLPSPSARPGRFTTRLPENLHVADASLIPESLGNPPILTIVALAKRIGRIVAQT